MQIESGFIQRKSFQLTATTAIQAIHCATAYLQGTNIDLIDLMGYSGHAFRIQVDPQTVSAAGSTAYEWGPVLSKGLNCLGIHSSYKGGPGCTLPSSELVIEAIDSVQQSIDRGVPAIVWDSFLPEFGVLYGYDDDLSCLYGKDLHQKNTIAYEELGKGRTGELFVLVLTGTSPIAPKEALRNSLNLTLTHLEGREFTSIPDLFRCGISGYDAWLDAFHARTVEPNGNARHICILHDSREFAVAFLSRLHSQWGSDTSSIDRRVRDLAGKAAFYYAETVKALRGLRILFPDPYGGEPHYSHNAQAAIRLIQDAKVHEEQGIELLKQMQVVLLS